MKKQMSRHNICRTKRPKPKKYVVNKYTIKLLGVTTSPPPKKKPFRLIGGSLLQLHSSMFPLTLIRMAKDEKGLAFSKGLIL